MRVEIKVLKGKTWKTGGVEVNYFRHGCKNYTTDSAVKSIITTFKAQRIIPKVTDTGDVILITAQ